MTAAKVTFDANAQRATYFLDIHKERQGGAAGAPTGPYRELPRGALVFAVGALDAYLSEVSAEILIARAQTAPAAKDLREALRKIQADVPGLALEVALLPTHAERLRRLQDSVVDHFQNYASNHGSKSVATVIQRLGGKVDDVWKAMQADGFPNAPADLDKWTAIRHDIVHKGKKPQVRRPDAARFIALCVALVDRLEALV